jgi:hypothetical protein
MKKLVAVCTVVASLSPLAAVAEGNHYGWGNGNNPHAGWGNDNNSHAAPAPIVGAGLPSLVLAGLGYLVYRRKQKKD